MSPELPSPGREAIYQDLAAAARRRFGEARATALDAELQALAAHLALIAETPIPDAVEPDFVPPSG